MTRDVLLLGYFLARFWTKKLLFLNQKVKCDTWVSSTADSPLGTDQGKSKIKIKIFSISQLVYIRDSTLCTTQLDWACTTIYRTRLECPSNVIHKLNLYSLFIDAQMCWLYMGQKLSQSSNLIPLIQFSGPEFYFWKSSLNCVSKFLDTTLFGFSNNLDVVPAVLPDSRVPHTDVLGARSCMRCMQIRILPNK